MNNDIDPRFPAAHYQDGRDLNCHPGKAIPKELPPIEWDMQDKPDAGFAVMEVALFLAVCATSLLFVVGTVANIWPVFAALMS